MARNFDVKDVALTDQIRMSQHSIFCEDVEVLEGQQRYLLANPGRRLMTLNIDSGGAHARRIIDGLISRGSEQSLEKP